MKVILTKETYEMLQIRKEISVKKIQTRMNDPYCLTQLTLQRMAICMVSTTTARLYISLT